MAGKKIVAVAKRSVWAFGLLLIVSQISKGERLPIKSYTSADGLAHNVVQRIVRDSRGFLWFCTREGLSRFDGYSFTNYGIEQGLPSAIVNDLLETREGVYWVATSGGLCRFNPLGNPQANISNALQSDAANPIFTVYFPGEDARSRLVLSLFQDRAGGIFCGTGNGLYRLEGAARELNRITSNPDSSTACSRTGEARCGWAHGPDFTGDGPMDELKLTQKIMGCRTR